MLFKALLLAIGLVFSPPADYAKIFGSDYQDALDYVRKHKVELLSICRETEADSAELSAILFPELIRYSMLRDFFETQSLELLYVNFGAETADFSIGQFQMKPSFAEAVEAYLRERPALAAPHSQLLDYAAEAGKERRKARLKRLQEDAWQLRYAAAFLAVAKDKFGDRLPADPADRIRFLATAYNHGFQSSAEAIRPWIVAQNFPYGPRYPGPQHSYADISADFFQKHFPYLMTN